MHRALLIIAAVLLLSCLGVVAYNASHDDNSTVYFRMIEEPSDALDASRVEWLEQKDRQKGVYIYSLEGSNPHEFLFYDNTRRGENLYVTSELHATLHGEVLRIDISDKDAVDDGYVNDRILAYFIMKQQPASIEVYRNGVSEQYEIEKGRGKISL